MFSFTVHTQLHMSSERLKPQPQRPFLYKYIKKKLNNVLIIPLRLREDPIKQFVLNHPTRAVKHQSLNKRSLPGSEANDSIR